MALPPNWGGNTYELTSADASGGVTAQAADTNARFPIHQIELSTDTAMDVTVDNGIARKFNFPANGGKVATTYDPPLAGAIGSAITITASVAGQIDGSISYIARNNAP